ncbi:MarR family winged helix-turn-helix transcriptional regulator [Terriglobus sp. RCC_193]|uniref:MarR family winged helix-turn-helix transcriptional regulator n=1 Tax=Terriglobus sp. RCC_193 TaxID=3239218 RepID=UPI00352363A8
MRKSKQENRDDAAKAISLTMKRLMTNMRLLLEAELESDGMTLAQLRMLNAVHEESDISSAELARTCYITPQSMQSLVVRAEREGWIKRSPSPRNRRILTTVLTPKGKKAYERAIELWAVLSHDMWAETKLEQMQELNAVLSAAVDRLQPRLDDLHQRQSAKRKSA